MVKTIMVPVSWSYDRRSREDLETEATFCEKKLDDALKEGFSVLTSHLMAGANRQLVVLILHKPDGE